MRLNDVLTVTAAAGISFLAGTIAYVKYSKPNDTASDEQTSSDSRLLDERITHCRDLVEAVQNEASIIQSITSGKETSEPITCLQFKSHQDRRSQAQKICSALQKDLPQYCTNGPDISSQIHRELAKLGTLPFDVDVNCDLKEPVKYLNCELNCEKKP